MEKITIYQKPTCTTCRKVSALLKEKGILYDAVDYYLEPLTQAKLLDLLKKMKAPAVSILRKKEAIYKKLNLAGKKLSDEKLVSLMAQYPDLIERPIIEKGDKAILARPPEKLLDIF